ncbi:MAG: DNA starvation/stationary phase protection protein [Bacilli bacterium]|nr:DNA starvation/stationary phase protection protein [Bacilli bacterium]
MNNSKMMMIGALNKYLSSIAVTTLNMYNFHWNIKDPFFIVIHKKTEEYYEMLTNIFDEVAERIKILEGYPIASLPEYCKISVVKCAPSKDYTREEIISMTIYDFEILLAMTNEIAVLAQNTNDIVTLDLMTKYAAFLGKQLWMLKSQLS